MAGSSSTIRTVAVGELPALSMGQGRMHCHLCMLGGVPCDPAPVNRFLGVPTFESSAKCSPSTGGLPRNSADGMAPLCNPVLHSTTATRNTLAPARLQAGLVFRELWKKRPKPCPTRISSPPVPIPGGGGRPAKGPPPLPPASAPSVPHRDLLHFGWTRP